MSTEPAAIYGDSAPPPLGRLIDHLKTRYADRITGELSLPARSGNFVPLPATLEPRLARALLRRGISRLYSHQLETWDHLARGKHCVVVTPTASGKSLCYNLPVIDAALKTQSKALYLFPTKALSQDQVAEINDLNKTGNLGLRAYTFDGDTPGDARKAVRTKGDIVVSNPDMLHQAILPHHTKWAQFFEGLAFVVIDEMHSYRGVFGAHFANLMRRLQRICRFYGVKPRFILTSATIANPAQLAGQLLNEPVAAVNRSGAPQGEKHLLLWNPPVINPDLGIRASARSQTVRLARLTLGVGLKAILFARSRLAVEVITKYLKDLFDRDPRHPPRIAAYRGGYLPTERRQIERQLRSDRLDCVVTTSALELGMDIGALDVCLLNGYPGSIASTWQRLGRAGRRDRPALGVLVAGSEPLDQYLVRNPYFFLGASPEQARIDPDQLLILLDHVRCAAFELPFRQGEIFGGENLEELLSYLAEQGLLHREGERWHWIADSYPANSVSLRSVAEGNFVVIDSSGGGQTIVAEVDFSSVPMTLYPGAIYLIQSRPFQVERLDWTGRKAFVTATRADYYTDAIDYTRLKILDRFQYSQSDRAEASLGEVHLVRRIPGYKKIRYYSHENIGYGSIALPDQEMHTTAVWWRLAPAALKQVFEGRRQAAIEGFLGAAYTLHHLAVIRTLAELRDLGRAVGSADGSWFAAQGADGRGQIRASATEASTSNHPSGEFQPTLFLYDNYPGGIGLAAALYDLRSRLPREAEKLIRSCECRAGCPACVGPVMHTEEAQQPPPKAAALRVLELMCHVPR